MLVHVRENTRDRVRENMRDHDILTLSTLVLDLFLVVKIKMHILWFQLEQVSEGIGPLFQLAT